CTGDGLAQYNELISQPSNAAFQLRAGGFNCGFTEMYIPGLDNIATGPNVCPDGGVGVYLLQVRGEFGTRDFKTTGNYHTLFAQDAWSINKYVTINAGLRWEQQQVEGVNAKYTFTDNWSPRVGIAIDPWGNRKTKIFANFGRYVEAMPLDIAIRSLSNEKDITTMA